MDAGERRRLADELVRQHYPLLFRLAYRLAGRNSDAEDLVQQAMLIACSRLEQLRQPDQAGGWLCSIVRTVFLQSRRRTVRQVSADEEWWNNVGDKIPTKPAIDGDDLQAILDEMPETYRVPLIMFYFCDLETRAIASELGVAEGTISSRLSRGREYLRRRWRRNDK